jgi:hypothetical protein
MLIENDMYLHPNHGMEILEIMEFDKCGRSIINWTNIIDRINEVELSYYYPRGSEYNGVKFGHELLRLILLKFYNKFKDLIPVIIDPHDPSDKISTQ